MVNSPTKKGILSKKGEIEADLRKVFLLNHGKKRNKCVILPPQKSLIIF